MHSSCFSRVYSCALLAYMIYSNSWLQIHSSLFSGVYSCSILAWAKRTHDSKHTTLFFSGVYSCALSVRMNYMNSSFQIHNSRVGGVYSCAISARMGYMNSTFYIHRFLFNHVYSCAILTRLSYMSSRSQIHSPLFSSVYSCALSAHVRYLFKLMVTITQLLLWWCVFLHHLGTYELYKLTIWIHSSCL